ncbi:MAG: metal-dependent hydrolase [Deltaproteobacteria bacterium]|jgi:L-ascorbate metabolism protein UlaG (beta-lactamase superfamily)|nr:metal-dependent hydrolase [Deltaproteobacteria bacterium]
MPTKLTWHGHANFQIEAAGANVLVDPFFTGNPKATVKWKDISRPDLVLVTHLHGDHAGDSVAICNYHGSMLGGVVGLVEKLAESGLDPQLILNGIGFNIGGTVSHQDVKVTMTEAFHTSEAGCPVGYIIIMPNGFTIYHAGDTGIFRNLKTWGELYSIDLALLPAGGTFTMDARQAALAAKFLKAKTAVPMHWGTFPVLAQDASDFERELAATAPDCRPIIMQPGQTVVL